MAGGIEIVHDDEVLTRISRDDLTALMRLALDEPPPKALSAKKLKKEHAELLVRCEELRASGGGLPGGEGIDEPLLSATQAFGATKDFAGTLGSTGWGSGAQSRDSLEDTDEVLMGTMKGTMTGSPSKPQSLAAAAMANVADYHLLFARSSEQIKLVDDQPFPHTLPT